MIMNDHIKQNKETAIKVENLSKTFVIPHEKESTMKGAAVSLLNSRKKGYETFNALKSVDFEVKKGEFFGIIGRNGCGKSTLLKILAGIYVPDKGNGKVTINGKLSPFLELGVGFNPELTGRENIFLGGTILGLTQRQITERYDKIVAFSELEEFIDMKLRNYSSGMQVRLAFSLAINVEAEILLMDEVLAVGDSNFQSKCLAEFNKYREQGKTVILVTHDISVVQRYCDRAMLLRSGQVVKIGDSEEVTSEYMNQNINDEDKRIDQNESSENAVGNKSRLAGLIKAETFDGNGKRKSTFKSGDNMIIRVYFDQKKQVDDINFGIALVNQENVTLLGISTVIDKLNVKEAAKNGFFEVEFKDIPFRESSFHINAAIFGNNHAKVYDYKTKLGTFRVFSTNQNDGIVSVPYKWRV